MKELVKYLVSLVDLENLLPAQADPKDQAANGLDSQKDQEPESVDAADQEMEIVELEDEMGRTI